MKQVLYFLLILTPLSAAANDVESLIAHRLNLCVDVAQYKIAHHLPITNVKQEQKVLATAQQKAAEYHLDSKSVLAFTQQLILSCKQIQKQEISKNEKVRKFKSLEKLRQELNSINQQIFIDLSKNQGRSKKDWPQHIKNQLSKLGINQTQLDALLVSLNSLREK